jgi:multidrug efflux pump
MANFFIDRPIFAWVLAIILCLTGALAIFSLPVEQYPNLAPPNVRISATYPGASAQTLENTVTQIIEQNMTGLDNMMYMSSQSTNTGQATVTLTFEAGTDPNEAMQQVQNQLQAAIKRLPQAVQNQGVTVSKSGDTTLMMVAFVSTDNSMDKQDIADYIVSNLQDPLSRINGVGSMDVYGSQYAMRIWLDPNKLNSYQLTTQDVVKAIQSQNAQVAVGQLGGTPSVDKQALNATINAQSQLQTPEQFRQITLRVNQDGSLVTLGNVATVELGGENYNYLSRYNGMQAAGMNIKLASGANELQTDQLVKDKIAELSQYFPRGLEAKVAYETTPFVKADQGRGENAAGSHPAGVPGDVPVPAEFPRHADPHHRRAGGANGHLRHPVRLRLQHQHPHHVRHGVGDRPAGGRRHRGGGKRRTRDERRRPAAA